MVSVVGEDGGSRAGGYSFLYAPADEPDAVLHMPRDAQPYLLCTVVSFAPLVKKRVPHVENPQEGTGEVRRHHPNICG